MVQVGDRVRVDARRVGQGTREGVVLSVNGAMIRVRWQSGEESVFTPSAGSLTVVGRAR